MPKPTPIERRMVLAGLAAGAGMVAASGLAAGALEPAPEPVLVKKGTERPTPPAPAPEHCQMFQALSPGTTIDRWTVAAVHPLLLGAVPVVLESGGERFQVDVLRRDQGGPQPVAQTPSLALFLSNQGDGNRGTAEEQGLGAMALAGYLSSREAAGVPVPELLTLRERSEHHARSVFCVV